MDEALAKIKPEGVVEMAEREEVCARMIETEGKGVVLGSCEGAGGRGVVVESRGGRRTT